jgi:hypothetical protein
MLHIWVHASIESGGVIETSKVVDVLLPLGRKQHSYVQRHMLCLHYTLCLMQLSVVHNLILKGSSDDSPRVDYSHRCSWMAVYVSCCNAQSKSHSDLLDICMLSLFYQFPNCNLFTQHVLFISWRDTTSELWTAVQFPLDCYHLFTLLALFTFSHTTITFHSIGSFLCLQQIGEIDNLIVSWEQSIWLCCVQVPRCC